MARLQDMPTELMLLVFSYLGLNDIMELSSLSRSLYRTTQVTLGSEFSISLADYSTDRPPKELSHTTRTIDFFTTICRFRSLALRTRCITAHVLAEQTNIRHHVLPHWCESAMETIPFTSLEARGKITEILDDHRRHTSLLLILLLCRNLVTLSIKSEISLSFIQDLSHVLASYRPHPELRSLAVEWARERGNEDSLQGYDLQDVKLLLSAPKLRSATFVSLLQSAVMNWSPETRFLRGPKRKAGDDASTLRSWSAIRELTLQHCVLPVSWPAMLSPFCLGTLLTHLEFIIPLRKSPNLPLDVQMLNLEAFSEALNRISSTLEVLKVDVDLPLIPWSTMLGAVIHAKWDFLDIPSMDRLHKLVLPWFWWTSTSGRNRQRDSEKSCVGWTPSNLRELVLLKCEIEDEDVVLSAVINDLIAQRQSKHDSKSEISPYLQRIILEASADRQSPPGWLTTSRDLARKGKSVGIDIELQTTFLSWTDMI